MNSGRRFSLSMVVVAVVGAAAIAFLLWDTPSAPVNLGRRLTAPGADAWLGTDQLGRDLGNRLLMGAPWSLGVAFAATLIAAILGIAVGLAAGEFDGVPRRALLQLVNLTLSFPGLVAAMAAVAIVGQSNTAVFLVLGLLSWPVFARVCYAETLVIKERAYVSAARIGGVRPHILLWRHVLPALAPSLIAMVSFHFAEMLVASSALSFLGIGLSAHLRGAQCCPRVARTSFRRHGCSLALQPLLPLPSWSSTSGATSLPTALAGRDG